MPFGLPIVLEVSDNSAMAYLPKKQPVFLDLLHGWPHKKGADAPLVSRSAFSLKVSAGFVSLGWKRKVRNVEFEAFAFRPVFLVKGANPA